MTEAVKLAQSLTISKDEWLLNRRKGIGGSDASAVIGVNKWKTPLALWLEKTGQKTSEPPGEATYWGIELEEIVAREFKKRTGLKVIKEGALLQHKKHDFMIANVDRLIIGQESGLECKTANAFMLKEWEDDNIPDAYYVQCQHYMGVTGFASWWIAVLIGGQNFIYKEIPRNDEFINALIGAEATFWQHVTNMTMPEVEFMSESDLKAFFPNSIQKTIELPEVAYNFINQYEEADAMIKVAEARKDEAKNILCNMLQDAEAGKIGDKTIIWKSTKPAKRFDSKTLEAEQPDIYAKYIKFGEPSRRFSIK